MLDVVLDVDLVADLDVDLVDNVDFRPVGPLFLVEVKFVCGSGLVV